MRRDAPSRSKRRKRQNECFILFWCGLNRTEVSCREEQVLGHKECQRGSVTKHIISTKENVLGEALNN